MWLDCDRMMGWNDFYSLVRYINDVLQTEEALTTVKSVGFCLEISPRTFILEPGNEDLG